MEPTHPHHCFEQAFTSGLGKKNKLSQHWYVMWQMKKQRDIS